MDNDLIRKKAAFAKVFFAESKFTPEAKKRDLTDAAGQAHDMMQAHGGQVHIIYLSPDVAKNHGLAVFESGILHRIARNNLLENECDQQPTILDGVAHSVGEKPSDEV